MAKTKFSYRVISPEKPTLRAHAEMSANPTLRELKAAIGPHFGGAEFEHVAILKPNGHSAADMFVNETGIVKGLPRNDEATRLYRANWLKRHPKDDPESLPYIAGAAVVFEERVWSN